MQRKKLNFGSITKDIFVDSTKGQAGMQSTVCTKTLSVVVVAIDALFLKKGGELRITGIHPWLDDNKE